VGGLTTKTAGYDDAKNRKRRMSDAIFRMRRDNTCKSTKSFNDATSDIYGWFAATSDIDAWFDASWMNILMRISIGRTVNDDIYLPIIRHGLGQSPKSPIPDLSSMHSNDVSCPYEHL
jgi:hypothetical protein